MTAKLGRLLHAALSMAAFVGLIFCGGCRMNALKAEPSGGGTAAAFDGPSIRVAHPKLSPDGKEIYFVYIVDKKPGGIAVVSTDEEARVRLLDLPPNLEWRRPTVSADKRYLLLVSVCMNDHCPDGNDGYRIWRYDLKTHELRRLIGEPSDVFFDTPVFGASNDDIYYVRTDRVVTDIQKDNPLSSQAIYRANGPFFSGTSYFEKESPGPRLGTIVISGRIFDGNIYAIMRITKQRGAENDSLQKKVVEANLPSIPDTLALHISGGNASIYKPFPISDVMTYDCGRQIVYVKSSYVENKLMSEVFADDGNHDEFLFGVHKLYFVDMSVSEDGKSIAYRGNRQQADGRFTIWLYDRGTRRLRDLNVMEKISSLIVPSPIKTENQE